MSVANPTLSAMGACAALEQALLREGIALAKPRGARMTPGPLLTQELGWGQDGDSSPRLAPSA